MIVPLLWMWLGGGVEFMGRKDICFDVFAPLSLSWYRQQTAA